MSNLAWIEALEALKYTVKYKYTGICLNMVEFPGVQLVCEMARTWEYYSGDCAFPIPSSEPGECPQVAYYSNKKLNKLWQGRQLRLRLLLIDHCIAVSRTVTKQGNRFVLANGQVVIGMAAFNKIVTEVEE